jgi:hypothetical protein
MEPIGSLPRSREPAIGPCPNQFDPLHTPFEINFNIIRMRWSGYIARTVKVRMHAKGRDRLEDLSIDRRTVNTGIDVKGVLC